MNSSEQTRPCLIRAEALSWRSGQVLCVRDASLDVHAGAFIIVTGTNGSGKTTLCDLLTGYASPTTGGITVLGERAARSNVAWFGKRGIRRTFQAPRTFDQMTILDSMLLASRASQPPTVTETLLWQFGVRSESSLSMHEKVAELLECAGWAGQAKCQTRTLSYGQRKLVAALTLRVCSGNVAICDEPTAGLDAGKAEFVLGMLADWQAEDRDRAVLITIHDLEAVGIRASRTFRMDRGVLKEVE